VASLERRPIPPLPFELLRLIGFGRWASSALLRSEPERDSVSCFGSSPGACVGEDDLDWMAGNLLGRLVIDMAEPSGRVVWGTRPILVISNMTAA
jgi:hypothetical protein